MKMILPSIDIKLITRREAIRVLGATAALAALPKVRAASADKDSLPMQFYKSLTEEQHAKICLPVDHPKRQFVSNWWYICPEQRLNTFYTKDQQALLFDVQIEIVAGQVESRSHRAPEIVDFMLAPFGVAWLNASTAVASAFQSSTAPGAPAVP